MRKLTISVLCVAVLVGVGAIAQTSRALAVDSGTLSNLLGGCPGECDVIYPCQQCTGSGTSWTMCTASATNYIECDSAEDPDDGIPCGTCTSWGAVCGTYQSCSGPYGCINCQSMGDCSGCSAVSGADTCD
jgi:hypothetical protein